MIIYIHYYMCVQYVQIYIYIYIYTNTYIYIYYKLHEVAVFKYKVPSLFKVQRGTGICPERQRSAGELPGKTAPDLNRSAAGLMGLWEGPKRSKKGDFGSSVFELGTEKHSKSGCNVNFPTWKEFKEQHLRSFALLTIMYGEVSQEIRYAWFPLIAKGSPQCLPFIYRPM